MKNSMGLKQFFVGLFTGIFIIVVFLGGAVTDRLSPIPAISNLLGKRQLTELVSQRILTEESVVVDVAQRVSPSVVTVTIEEIRQVPGSFFLDSFGIFRVPNQSETETIERDIGSGFVVGEDGLIVTNKHVVSGSLNVTYKVVMSDDREYEIVDIWRDPLNDLAILKVEAENLPVVEMGNSDNLKVGQFVIAIGTALGEFRHTVTTGVISGLGRGITTGNIFGSYVEELDNVIQTDAAINPGNSGGPLLNSVGQVIGVNVAVSQSGENIGFALPINVVVNSLDIFNSTGQFDRPTFGVRYRLIGTEVAVLNDVPAGALVVEVLPGSSAKRAGIEVGDIVVSFDSIKVSEVKGGLAELMLEKSIGDTVVVLVYSSGVLREIQVELIMQLE